MSEPVFYVMEPPPHLAAKRSEQVFDEHGHMPSGLEPEWRETVGRRYEEAGWTITPLIAVDPLYAEIRAERDRAHAKHGPTSMERLPSHDPRRLAVLVEEVGEVARHLNECVHTGEPVDRLGLRIELIQVAAMAAAWADVIVVHDSGVETLCDGVV